MSGWADACVTGQVNMSEFLGEWFDSCWFWGNGVHLVSLVLSFLCACVYMCVCVCVFIYVCVCECVCVHVCVCVCVFICMLLCVFLCVFVQRERERWVCMFGPLCVPVCVCMYMCASMYVPCGCIYMYVRAITHICVSVYVCIFLHVHSCEHILHQT